MDSLRTVPWPGVAIALLGGAGLLVGGAPAILVPVILLLWIASLWISREEPAPEPIETEGVQINRGAIQSMFENSINPLILVDRNRITIANSKARRILGQHIVGQDPRIALRHPSAIKLLDKPNGGKATIPRLKGPRSIWELNVNRIDTRYGIVEMRDRSAEADVSRAHTDFVANASHELRTPLASIIGYIETLVEQGSDVDGEVAERFHKTVLKEAQRLQSLVSDLMSLSRVEAEKHDRPEEDCDLLEIAQSAISAAGRPEDRARIGLRAEAKRYPIKGDARQLEQLIRNLVENSLKYGDTEKPVEVSLVDDGKRHLLTVADQGEGIAREHLPHLTRRFYRTDPGRSRAAGGTGLGLAIVKHIAERHQARLDIESEVGRGTSVKVAFPHD